MLTVEVHVKRAEVWLEQAEHAGKKGDIDFAMYAIAIAQVHATLAVAKK